MLSLKVLVLLESRLAEPGLARYVHNVVPPSLKEGGSGISLTALRWFVVNFEKPSASTLHPAFSTYFFERLPDARVILPKRPAFAKSMKEY
jgi:hypothetical protein